MSLDGTQHRCDEAEALELERQRLVDRCERLLTVALNAADWLDTAGDGYGAAEVRSAVSRDPREGEVGYSGDLEEKRKELDRRCREIPKIRRIAPPDRRGLL